MSPNFVEKMVLLAVLLLSFFAKSCRTLNVTLTTSTKGGREEGSSILQDRPVAAKIIEGNATFISTTPHTVVIYHNDTYMCLGHLVKKDRILVPGSCIQKTTATPQHFEPNYVLHKQFKIRSGSGEAEHGGSLTDIDRCEFHPEYPKKVDAAVCVTVAEINDTADSKKAEIGTDYPTDVECLVTGFGIKSKMLHWAEDLESMIVVTREDDACKEKYGSHYIAGYHLCAEFPFNRRYEQFDPTFWDWFTNYYWSHWAKLQDGDDGAGLVCNQKLVGLAIFKIESQEDKKNPLMFTNLIKIKDWVMKASAPLHPANTLCSIVTLCLARLLV